MPDGTRSGSLTIGALSRATGIPTATLRTWERRYTVPRSVRKPSGHRLYSIEEVPHLLRVRAALALGHRPAELLPLHA
jgi:DNA-binding transcriptional MerR regulator